MPRPHLTVRHLTPALLLTLLASSTAFGQVSAKQTIPIPDAPMVVDGIPQALQAPVQGPGEEMNLAPGHPPFDQIPPMPMPEIGPLMPTQSDSVMWHDAQTGITQEMPVAPQSGLEGGTGSGFVGLDAYVSRPELARNFGTMTGASGLSNFPAAPNCKLVMRFVDQNGIARFFVASGAMQDSGVVLTAAHCVYARSPNVGGNTINIFSWATDVWIYPGWDGVGTGGNPGPGATELIQNFGWTHGSGYIAGTDWVNNGNFDRDMAAISINRGSDRSVGMLTGWYGYAWGFDCSTIQNRTYYNFSFPAEDCDNGGPLHTGRNMQFWSGGFDSCPGNQLQLNTNPGCFTAVWGGQSGSNAYYFDNNLRVAHAVCSNSNRSTSGRYAKMWEQFSIDLNTFRTNTRGSTFDLEALRARLTGSTTIQATTTSSNVHFVAANTTNANPAAGTYTARVYLSTNNVISGGDTLVGTFNFNNDFAALQGLTVNLPGVTIPNVAPGTYWLGVILDGGTDAFTGNNATSLWDAQQIAVTAAPPPAPANNGCGSAFTYLAGSTVNGTTANATADGASLCGNSNSTGDVWYRMVPPLSGTLRLNTCGSLYDTVMSVHTSCPGGTGNQLACNDDNAGSGGNNACGGGNASGIDLSVTAGATYYVRVGGYNGATGNFVLDSYYLAPSNDACSTATAHSVGSTSVGSLAGASNDGQASCGSSGSASDAWYVITPGQTGYLRLDTCGSSFDTVLSVHTSCPGNLGNQIACNDDNGIGGNGVCGGGLSSGLDIGVTAGATYYVRIAGFDGGVGSFNLHSSFIAPPNDTCAGAITYVAGSMTTGVTTAAGFEGSSNCGSSNTTADVWYRMVASCTGTLRMDTCGSAYDTVISVHTACPGSTGNQLVCNDDHGSGGAGGCGGLRDSSLSLNVVSGATYFIRVSGFDGATGAFNLNSSYLSFGANECAQAPAVTIGAYSVSNCGATNDGPEENLCSFCCGDVQVNNDMWFSFVGPFYGTITVDTCASVAPYDTKLAVYQGDCPMGNPDTAIACNDDTSASCGQTGTLSRTTFTCLPGQNYLIRLGGFNIFRGTATLTIGGSASCGTQDYNGDGDFGTDQDVEAFFACLAGHCCATCFPGRSDFNGDGDYGTDQDIEAFFRVLAGHPC